jgi:hypothetical protein
MKKHEPFLKLIHELLGRPADPGRIHVCPVCGDKLEVSAGAYIRGEKSMVGTTADCRGCDIRLHLQSAPAPAWLSVPDDMAFRRWHREWLQRDPPSSNDA